MTKKKIVIIRSNPVNPDSRVEKEANTLLKAGYKVSVLAWDRDEKYKITKDKLVLLDGKAEIIRFGIPATYGDGIKNIKAFIKFQLSILKWLLKYKNEYDIIHACDFDTGFTAYLSKKITKKKLVFDIFDYLYTDINGRFKWFKKTIVFFQHKIINNSEGTIICTEERINQIKGSKPKRLAVIHNSPPNLNKTLNKLYLGDKIKIAYIGILQDYRFLIELSDIVKSDDRLELHIGGFGKYEEYFEKCSKKYNNIKFYGKLSYDKTLELENSCDIITAIYDPKIGNHVYAAPNKFYEALMLGKPLIMIKGTGMSNIVEGNDIGEVVDFDIESLKCGIDRLISKKTQWQSMGARMQQIYSEKYSWCEMEKRLINFYNSIISNF